MSDSNRTHPTREGKKLIEDYHNAFRHMDICERNLKLAQITFKNAKNELAKWLLPNDWRSLEIFAIWDRDDYGNECLYVARGVKDETDGTVDYSVEIRKRS